MQEGKVKIADGLPKTRARLENFKSKMKLETPNRKITMGDAIEFAIEQADRVPILEQEIRELKEKLHEFEKVSRTPVIAYQDIKTKEEADNVASQILKGFKKE